MRLLRSSWIWAGVAVGCGVAVLVVPEARWHALDGLSYSVNLRPEWTRALTPHVSPRVIPSLPPQHQPTFEEEIALATTIPSIDPKGEDEAAIRERINMLEEIRGRYPDRPSICAHLGRYYAAMLRLGWTYRGAQEGDPDALATRPDWERFRELMIEGSRCEPQNAFFLQMLAAAYLGLSEPDKAWLEWRKAAQKQRWDDYAKDEVFAQWALLTEVYGKRGARQRYPSIAMLRLPHLAMIEEAAALLIAFTPEQLGDPGADTVAVRLATAHNGALIRDEARQVVAGAVGVEVVERAIQYPHWPSGSPKIAATRRGNFLRLVGDDRPDVREYVREQERRNQGYTAQIPVNSAIEFTGWNTVSGRPGSWTGWLFRSIASGSVPESAFALLVRFLMVFAVARGVLWLGGRLRFYLPERLRAALSLAAGVGVGFVAYLGSDLWVVGLWYAMLAGGLGYASSATDVGAKSPAAGTDYVVWTRRHTFISTLVAVTLLAVSVYGFIFRFADFPSVHVALTGVDAPFTGLTAWAWELVSWFAASLPLVLAIAWAVGSGTPLILGTAEGLARLSVVGAVTCMVVFVLLLPVAVLFDRADVERLELIAKHEPNYYRRAAEPIMRGYHEHTEP